MFGSPGERFALVARRLASLDEDIVTFDFDEIEKLIGSKLPESAWKHRAWWANTYTHSQAFTWIQNGWIVSTADLEAGEVTFQRA